MALSYVAHTSAKRSTSGDLTFTAGAGNLLVACYGGTYPAGPARTISKVGGGAETWVGPFYIAYGGEGMGEMSYCLSASGDTNGVRRVSSYANYEAWTMLEFTGATTWALVPGGTGIGHNEAIGGAAATTFSSGNIVIPAQYTPAALAGWYHNSTDLLNAAFNSPWADGLGDNNQADYAAQMIVSGAGTHAASGTINNGTHWQALIAAFYDSAAGAATYFNPLLKYDPYRFGPMNVRSGRR